MKKQLLETTFRSLRKHFPALTYYQNAEKPLYFFDNSAGTQLPTTVIERMNHFLIRDNAQKGGIFTRLNRMESLITEAKQSVVDLIGAKDETEVHFGLNASSILALYVHHLARSLKPGDHIIVTQAEHNANVFPWLELLERGIIVDRLNVLSDGTLNLRQYKELLAYRPKIVALGCVSNAIGTIQDIKQLTHLAHTSCQALVLIDGVQMVSHLPVDVKDLDVDLAVFSAYKIFGPHLGFGYINRENSYRFNDFKIQELIKDTCHTLHIGTQNHEGIAGFLGAIDYLEIIAEVCMSAGLSLEEAALPHGTTLRRKKLYHAMHWASQYEQYLSHYFISKAKDYPSLIRYGIWDETQLAKRVPVFTFNIEGIPPEKVGYALDAMGIEARVGDFYASGIMQLLAPDYGNQGVRISLIQYNTTEDIDYFFSCLYKIIIQLKGEY